MQIPEFNSPEIRRQLPEFLERAKSRLVGLDGFNADLKNVERLLKAHGIPEFVALCPPLDARDEAHRVWWDEAEQRLMYKGHDAIGGLNRPLLACPATTRHLAFVHNWLGLVLEEAIEELKRVNEAKVQR